MSSASSESRNAPPERFTALLHAAGHFFDHLATACRATVKSLEANAVTLVKDEVPQVKDMAAKIEAVLADNITAEIEKDLPRIEAAAEQAVAVAAPVLIADVGQVAVKAVEAAL